MKMDKNEGLQSRREFFKSAAKAALPVVGAVVLSQLPINAMADATGCNTCSGTCYTGCTGGCRTACNNTCKMGCKGGAYGAL